MRAATAVALTALIAACGSSSESTHQGGATSATAHRTVGSATVARASSATRTSHRRASSSAKTTPATLAVPSASGLERSAATYVRRFYAQLDAREFAAAWSRLPPSLRSSSGSFEAWRAGYDKTLSNDVSDVSVDTAVGGGALVSLTLRATDLDACADEVRQRFAVRWTLSRQSQHWAATAISVDKHSGRTPRLAASTCPGSVEETDSAADEGDAAIAGGDAPAFCETHVCIPNYPSGRGSTVMCADGEYRHSGGIQGACSHHGGVAGGSSSSSSAGHAYVPSTSTSSGGTVHVRGYTRKDGTYVHPYTRAERRAPTADRGLASLPRS